MSVLVALFLLGLFPGGLASSEAAATVLGLGSRPLFWCFFGLLVKCKEIETERSEETSAMETLRLLSFNGTN